MKNIFTKNQTKLTFWLIFWALVPDIFAFSHGPYEFSHSVVTFLVVFMIISSIKGRPYLPMFAWLFHILIDFFSNTTNFYSIELFYPFSSFRFGEWASDIRPILLVLSYIFTLTLTGYLFWKQKQESKSNSV